jgi:hypothetical protein
MAHLELALEMFLYCAVFMTVYWIVYELIMRWIGKK